jgi:hypothetical protein
MALSAVIIAAPAAHAADVPTITQDCSETDYGPGGSTLTVLGQGALHRVLDTVDGILGNPRQINGPKPRLRAQGTGEVEVDVDIEDSFNCSNFFIKSFNKKKDDHRKDDHRMWFDDRDDHRKKDDHRKRFDDDDDHKWFDDRDDHRKRFDKDVHKHHGWHHGFRHWGHR